MASHFPFTREELLGAFPVQFSKDMPLAEFESGGFCEVAPFQNIQWNDVSCDLLKREFEVACYFSPEAMCYYLPAFILCTDVNLEQMDLPVDYLLGMIAMTGDDAVRIEYKKRRWKRLTKQQVNIVRQWIEWLKETHIAGGLIHMGNAFNTVQQDNWNC